MDSMIPLIATLFILSMINERIVNFIKLQFSGKKVFGISLGNLKRKSAGGDENERNKRLIVINIVIGSLICIMLRADLINLMEHMNMPAVSIGWKNFSPSDIWDYITLVPGCFLTGCFLSLGSKFWHDLLDLLLYTKNLKSKLADNQTYDNMTGADQLNEYLDLSDADLVRLAIEQNSAVLKIKFPNIQFLNDSIQVVDGERKDRLGIYISDDNSDGLPDRVPVKLPGGKTCNVATEIISGVGIATVSGGLTGSLANSDLFGYAGSGCCILHDANAQNYLLTNCHVMTDGYLRTPIYNTDQPDVTYDDVKMGQWYYGNMTPMGDLALVKISDIDSFTDNYQPEKFAAVTRTIVKDDWQSLVVTARGNKCQTRPAYIIEVVTSQLTVKYKDSKTITFNSAILIGDSPSKNCKPVTREGDSGGVIYDAQMQVVGIITAVGDKYTYAIPITEFLSTYHLQLNRS